MLGLTEAFANQALDAITVDRGPYALLGDCQTKAGGYFCWRPFAGKDLKQSVARTNSVVEDLAIFRSGQ